MSDIFDKLYVKNGNSSIQLAGYHALNSLRMEKGYLHWGHDIGVEENPFEAGVGFCVNFNKKNPFLGQDALEKKKDSALKKRKVNFSLSNNDLLMYHNEPIFFDGKIVGEITSGMFGFYLDKSLGMGYISANDSFSIEEMLKLQKFEIEVAETKYKAKGSIKCFYDPDREKILI